MMGVWHRDAPTSWALQATLQYTESQQINWSAGPCTSTPRCQPLCLVHDHTNESNGWLLENLQYTTTRKSLPFSWPALELLNNDGGPEAAVLPGAPLGDAVLEGASSTHRVYTFPTSSCNLFHLRPPWHGYLPLRGVGMAQGQRRSRRTGHDRLIR